MTLEKNNDMEIALKLANHIKKPCGVNVEGRIYDIRYFYLRLAKETSQKLTNNYAREFLESVIAEYN